MYNINDLLDRILFNLESIKPLYCRQLDDPRIDIYYIPINQNYYMVLYGAYDECYSIVIYNNNNIKYNIITIEGLENFVNNYDEVMDATCNIIFELELDTFNGNINDLILLLTNSVKNVVPFKSFTP